MALRAPTLHDVAHRSGVSHQTVSRVINAHPLVKPTTRQRVLVAIDELDYQPNLAARELVHGPWAAATMDDVAQRAGVSVQTVSRVVNDYPHVAVATRRRVLNAIRRVRYQPNLSGRVLASISSP